MACALTPYKGITYMDGKGKERLAIEAVIREGLKVGTKNHYLDGIPALFSASELVKSPDVGGDKFKTPSERVAIGLLLRHISVHNVNIDARWTTSLLFSLIQELVERYDPLEDNLNVADAATVIAKYNRFAERVDELGLQGDVNAKPMLDGREILRILGASKPGRWTGKVLADVIEWQLGHPGGTKEQCGVWLKDELAAGRVSIEDAAPSAQAKRQRGGLEETAAKKTRT